MSSSVLPASSSPQLTGAGAERPRRDGDLEAFAEALAAFAGTTTTSEAGSTPVPKRASPHAFASTMTDGERGIQKVATASLMPGELQGAVNTVDGGDSAAGHASIAGAFDTAVTPGLVAPPQNTATGPSTTPAPESRAGETPSAATLLHTGAGSDSIRVPPSPETLAATADQSAPAHDPDKVQDDLSSLSAIDTTARMDIVLTMPPPPVLAAPGLNSTLDGSSSSVPEPSVGTLSISMVPGALSRSAERGASITLMENATAQPENSGALPDAEDAADPNRGLGALRKFGLVARDEPLRAEARALETSLPLGLKANNGAAEATSQAGLASAPPKQHPDGPTPGAITAEPPDGGIDTARDRLVEALPAEHVARLPETNPATNSDPVRPAPFSGPDATSLLPTPPVFKATAPNAPSAVNAPGAAEPASVPIDGLAAEFATRAVEGKRRFEIRLDPPELGRIDVRLDVARDGQVTSRVVVERSETLDLLRRDAATLERVLQSTGLRTDDSGLQFSLRDQSQGRWSAPATPLKPNVLIVPDSDVAVHEAVRRGYGALRGLGRGVDIRI